MPNATNLRGPDGEELIDRFGKRQQATGWTARNLAGERMVPPASPMQNMVDTLRAPVAPAPVAPPAAPKYTPPPVNPATGGYTANERIIQNGAGAGQPGPKAPPVAVGAPAVGPQATGAGAGGGGRTGVLGSVREGVSNLRTGVGAQPGPISKTAFLAGKVLSNPLVAGAGKVAGAAGAVQNFNDYKINDPDVDSSASGTWSALRDGDFSGAGQSLKKGLVETGMDLGSFAANTADLVVPGKAPVSTAYNKMLRDNLGNMLVDNSGSNTAAAPSTPRATGGSAVAPAATPAQTYPAANPASAVRQLRLGDPSSPDLKDEFSNASIESRNPGGKVTRVGNSYSGGNVSGEVSFQGADGNALRGRPGGGYMSTDTSAGFASDKRIGDKMEADRLRAESEGYARQDQQAAAGLAAQDRYENGLRERNASVKSTVGGLSGRARTAAEANQTRLAEARMQSETSLRTTGMNNDTSRQTTGMNNDTSLKTNDNTNRTALRGQDMDYEGRRIGAEATRAQLRYNMGKDARDFQLTKEKHDQEVGTKARENTMKEFEVIGEDGKPDLAAGKQSFDAVRQIFPGIDSADESTRNKFMADAKEMHGIFQKARTQDKVGWDSAKFWQTKRPNLSGMPDAVGRKDEMVGQLAGLFTIGASGGDTLLQRADGSSVNLGQLNERQRELLARAQKTGWGK